MARKRKSSDVEFGSDSFLDVIANLVGVLIILIVLIGLRVATAPPETYLQPARSRIGQMLETLYEAIAGLQKTDDRVADKVDSADELLAQDKDNLKATQDSVNDAQHLIQALERGVQQAVAKSKAQSTSLNQMRSQVSYLSEQIDSASQSNTEVEELVHQNPISRPTRSKELHFELSGGRIEFVNISALLESARGKSKLMEEELRTNGRATGSAGPAGTFRMRFTMARESLSFSESLVYSRGGFRARMVSWQIIPITGDRGEPVSRAIEDNSRFKRVLTNRPNDRFTVTLWTYPDSFDQFRQIRDYLHNQGYSVAARPLPPSSPIAGSINGSRSFVQ